MSIILTCAGRPTDRYLRQVGEPCGTTWRAAPGQTLDHARVTGWRVGPNDQEGPLPALCPRCVAGDQAKTEGPSCEPDDQLALFPPQQEGPAT